jgi:hypothetical protein
LFGEFAMCPWNLCKNKPAATGRYPHPPFCPPHPPAMLTLPCRRGSGGGCPVTACPSQHRPSRPAFPASRAIPAGASKKTTAAASTQQVVLTSKAMSTSGKGTATGNAKSQHFRDKHMDTRPPGNTAGGIDGGTRGEGQGGAGGRWVGVGCPAQKPQNGHQPLVHPYRRRGANGRQGTRTYSRSVGR